MSRVIKYIVTIFLKPLLSLYLKLTTTFHYGQFQLVILPGVFHPRFFFSSRYLASFVADLPLKGKSFCEPCAGSGIISLVASSKGAEVTCFDINPKAVTNIELNVERNRMLVQKNNIHIYLSNGFENVPLQSFDFIVLNPPYFFNDYHTSEQAAWNCGKNGLFFTTFFSKLTTYTTPASSVYMILAENCDIDRIKAIAGTFGLELSLVAQKKIMWEKNFIFQMKRIDVTK